MGRDNKNEAPDADDTSFQGQKNGPLRSSHNNRPKTQKSQASQHELLNAALVYAKMGFPVLPLHSVNGGHCTCGKACCKSVAKHPRVRHGLKDATTDETTIRSWWTKWPNANIAILTGKRSGIVVLDVDPQHGGGDTLSRLEHRFRHLPHTPESHTGGGGRHIIFQHPGFQVKTKADVLGPGLDIRGDGGYFVVPPSLHVSGSRYEWNPSRQPSNTKITPMPTWLIEKLRSATKPQHHTTQKRAQQIPEGKRNDTLTSLAGTMWRRGMSHKAIEGALTTENEVRCDPPLTEAEVQTIVASVTKYPKANETRTRKRPPVSADLIDIARNNCLGFFTDETKTPFVQFTVACHLETWPLWGGRFKRWLAAEYCRLRGRFPYGQTLTNARLILSGDCEEGPTHKLCNRAGRNQQALFYDLCDTSWKAVKITADGWDVIEKPPILFRRYEHQRPQVEPARGGDVKSVLGFLNLPNDENVRLLLQVYIVSCFLPDIPHPILLVTGSPGSAKTSFFRFIRAIVDPSVAGTLSFPREQAELVQQLQHNYMAYFDNVTRLPEWLSDALCRACTGEGVSKRRLYSDDQDVIYAYKRAVGINGVLNPAHRPDLLARCIAIDLERIPNRHRRTEAELETAFKEILPYILGGCFDALAKAMKLGRGVSSPALPRMADFARWGLSIAKALGYQPEQFLEAYSNNIQELNQMVIETNPFIQCCALLADAGQSGWEGTPTQLLKDAEITAEATGVSTKGKNWPSSPVWATRRVKAAEPNLEKAGYEVYFGKKSGGQQRTIIIRRANGGGEEC